MDSSWGYIDRSGRLVILDDYWYAGRFSEGLTAVTARDGTTGYIDTRGTLVIPLDGGEGRDFSDGLARVDTMGGVFINHAGTPVIVRSGIYWPYFDGLAVMGPSREAVYIDKRGLIVAPLHLPE